MKDMRVYDKYLNMKPKEKKKVDFKIRFDSKEQKIGVILFGIGLVLLLLGFIILIYRSFDNNVVPAGTSVQKNVNVKNFDGITSTDGKISIEPTTITFYRDKGYSDMNLVISSSEDVGDLPFIITFDMGGEFVVVADYISGVEANNTYELYKQNNNDLTQAKSWSVDFTTKEYLETNFGMVF